MSTEPRERNYKSSRSQIFFKIGVLKNFANSTGKYLCWSPLFNKVACLKTCNFIKKRLHYRCHEKETTEAVVRSYSSKQMLLKILKISQKNNCVGVSF